MQGMKQQGLFLAIVILASIFLTNPNNEGMFSKRNNQALIINQMKPTDVAAETPIVDEKPTINKTETIAKEPAVLSNNAISSSAINASNSQSTISAQIVLVKLLNTNTPLKEVKAENRWPIASLTKLMTALIAVENLDLDAKVKLSENAVSQPGTSGDFKSGEIYRNGDLLKAMLLLSSNDAAMALAESYGAEKDFVSAMNKKAAELKMTETKFVDPTGVSFLNQSTANDLAKLVDYIYFHHREIFDLTKEKSFSITEIQSGKIKKIYNINEFTGQKIFLGGKTGFINESKENLISLFDDPFGRGPLLIIVLGSNDRFGDTKMLLKELQ
jgi:D-alanyl-D-alanine carboxypeptidase